MTQTFDIDLLRRNLRAAMNARGLRPTPLSIKLSGNRTLIKDLLEKNDDLRVSTLFKIANELGVPASVLIEGDLASESDLKNLLCLWSKIDEERRSQAIRVLSALAGQ
jgi:transcriptional regulator with XRE-family HTH domain